MKDYLNIEGTPIDEPCAQVGDPDYYELARAECQAFKDQLIRTFGNPPGNASITVGQNPHDFGTYLDLRLNFNDESEEESDWAYEIEGDTPYNWDEEALAYLASKGYVREYDGQSGNMKLLKR